MPFSDRDFANSTVPYKLPNHAPTWSSVSSSGMATSSSATSLRSVTSGTSMGSISKVIPDEQRPIIITPALKTPTWPAASGVMSMVCATTISAPLAVVATLLLDTRTYGQWNGFCPGVTVTHQPRSTAPLPACLSKDAVLDSIANNFTTLRDGTTFTMKLCLDAEHQPSKWSVPTLQVSYLEQFERDGRQGVRLAWHLKGKLAKLLARSERVQELLPSVNQNGEPCVQYTCWETYYGMLANTMRTYMGDQLEAGYAAWMDGLREFAEKRAEVVLTPPSTA